MRVVGVSYAISQDGKDETVATLRLRLADPAAASFGTEFELEVGLGTFHHVISQSKNTFS